MVNVLVLVDTVDAHMTPGRRPGRYLLCLRKVKPIRIDLSKLSMTGVSFCLHRNPVAVREANPVDVVCAKSFPSDTAVELVTAVISIISVELLLLRYRPGSML